VYAEFAGVQPMSEDCLYLNVWTAAPDAQANWPVMVWIHGGAFQQGAGSNPVFVEGDLPQQGVVLVTLNYRLGPFGFMAHPGLSAEGHGASGNYGLQDIVAALRWVGRNIEAFGGDPDNVTLFGQSAGGAAVIDLMASREAQGLFAQAVSQSFGVTPMRTLEEAEQSGARFSGMLQAARVDDLRSLHPQRLLEVYLRQPDRWMPIADGRFLRAPVIELFARGEQQRVPLLTGWNADEGTTFAAAASVSAFRAELARRFGERAAEAQELYPAETDREAREASRLLTGDDLFALGVWRAARSHTRIAPTWVYHFDHPQPFHARQVYREASPASTLGVFHSSEYPYVFGSTGVLTRDWQPADAEVRRVMQDHWLAFARTGSPQVPRRPDWPRYDDAAPTVMRLGAAPRPGPLPRRAQLEFLDR
jgi:para-nitrobenzyl esterase